MRAHSDIKNILIFEKHEEFLRRPSPSSMSPPLRSESRCFFTCILLSLYPTRNCRESETHAREGDRRKTPAGTAFSPLTPSRRLHSRRSFSLFLLIHFVCFHTSDKLRNTHPNSAGLRRPSAPKHRLHVDAQEHVNSLKVLAKAQVNLGCASFACFRRGVWRVSAAGEGSGYSLLLLLLLLIPLLLLLLL